MDLRNVVDGGDAVVELRQSAEQLADIYVLWPVVAGEAGRPRRSGQHVGEVGLLRARRARAVVDQDAVGNGAADRRPGLMVMRVDEAGHHDLAARVDHVGASRGEIGTDRENLLALDQHVAARKIGHRRIFHRHDGAALDQIAPAGPAAVARRTVVVMRARRARREQARGSDRGRALQKIASREVRVLWPSLIAQNAHVRLPAWSHSDDGPARILRPKGEAV